MNLFKLNEIHYPFKWTHLIEMLEKGHLIVKMTNLLLFQLVGFNF